MSDLDSSFYNYGKIRLCRKKYKGRIKEGVEEDKKDKGRIIDSRKKDKCIIY